MSGNFSPFILLGIYRIHGGHRIFRLFKIKPNTGYPSKAAKKPDTIARILSKPQISGTNFQQIFLHLDVPYYIEHLT